MVIIPILQTRRMRHRGATHQDHSQRQASLPAFPWPSPSPSHPASCLCRLHHPAAPKESWSLGGHRPAGPSGPPPPPVPAAARGPPALGCCLVPALATEAAEDAPPRGAGEPAGWGCGGGCTCPALLIYWVRRGPTAPVLRTCCPWSLACLGKSFTNRRPLGFVYCGVAGSHGRAGSRGRAGQLWMPEDPPGPTTGTDWKRDWRPQRRLHKGPGREQGLSQGWDQDYRDRRGPVKNGGAGLETYWLGAGGRTDHPRSDPVRNLEEGARESLRAQRGPAGRGALGEMFGCRSLQVRS